MVPVKERHFKKMYEAECQPWASDLTHYSLPIEAVYSPFSILRNNECLFMSLLHCAAIEKNCALLLLFCKLRSICKKLLIFVWIRKK